MSEAIYHHQYQIEGKLQVSVLSFPMPSLVRTIRILSSAQPTIDRSRGQVALASNARDERRISMVQIEQRMWSRTTRVESQRTPRACHSDLRIRRWIIVSILVDIMPAMRV